MLKHQIQRHSHNLSKSVLCSQQQKILPENFLKRETEIAFRQILLHTHKKTEKNLIFHKIYDENE